MPADSIDLTLALQLLQTGPTGILLVNGQGRIRWLNDTLLGWLGMASDELVGKDQNTLPHPELQQLLLCSERLHLQPRHGPERWLSCQQVTLDGRPSNSLVAHFFLDDTPQEQLSHQLREQSLSDTLTGLPNRRALMLALEPQVSRCRRYNSQLSVVIMAINDAGGPDDSVQATQRLAVSRLLKDQLRWADLIGCSEDGEFILVLPETSEDDAQKLIQKLSGQLTPLHSSSNQRFSVCFGIAAWRKSDDASALLRRASLALAETRNTL